MKACRTKLIPCLAAFVLVSSLPIAVPEVASAQPVRNRVLQSLQVGRRNGNWEVTIEFSIPIRYLRHSPRHVGEIIQVQVRPLQANRSDASSLILRESLLRPRGSRVPFLDVTYDGNAPGGPQVEVRLARSMPFAVREGRDLRSLVVVLPEDGPLRGEDGRPLRQKHVAEAGKPAPPVDETPAQRWMREGREAMTAGEFQRAAMIFTKVLSLPEDDTTRDAQELLGVARERAGHLAHAVAEYETYLERYPEGEASDRVRQRLAALLTRREPAPERMAGVTPERPELDIDVWGSLYSAYRRVVRVTDDTGSDVVDSSLFTDVHMGARWRIHGYTLRSQMSGGYRLEFQDGTSDETRIDRLFLEATHDARQATLSLGRRSSSTGGVLGRYDGARLSYQLGEHWTLAGVAGFPVESSTSSWIDTDRHFAGLSLEAAGLFGGLDGELWVINQMLEGDTDRRAIGGELRFFRDGYFLAGLVDYDVHFTELNSFKLLGSWQATDSTFLNAVFDYRKVPTLTSYNALQGAPFASFSELQDFFGDGQIRSMAEDRTGDSITLSLSLSQDLTDHLQASLDFTATDLSGTDATLDDEGEEIVAGTSGTGWEFSILGQLVASRLWSPTDSTLLSLRYFEGQRADALLASLDGRYPWFLGVRANPRLRVEYRMDDRAPDFVAVRPSLRLDRRIWDYTIEAEAGGAWEGRSSGGGGDEWDYWMIFGVRRDF